MVDFPSELKKVESLLRQSYYTSSVLKSFQLLEFGFKDLYVQLERYLIEKNKKDDWDGLHMNFQRSRSEEFIFNRAGFGSMLLFARSTKFWDYVREMCESNLRFIRMVNWEHVRILRNHVTHKGFAVSRTDALEMLFWSKVFLYESGLVQGRRNPIPEVLDTDCTKCNHTISLSGNFCPHCGTPTHNACPSCNRDVNHRHKVCPYCDFIIMTLDKNTEEKERYKAYAEAVWADWIVTLLEREWLKNKRLELGLTMEEAKEIETKVKPENHYLFSQIIDSKRLDGKIDKYEMEFLMKKAANWNIPLEIATNLVNVANSPKQQKSSLRKLITMI